MVVSRIAGGRIHGTVILSVTIKEKGKAMKTQWQVSDISREIPMRSNELEFQDNKGEWHDFYIVVTLDRVVFGGACNAGFIESGYIVREDYESLDETLQEMLADLEVYYNDGPRYVSRIVCNERM